MSTNQGTVRLTLQQAANVDCSEAQLYIVAERLVRILKFNIEYTDCLYHSI